MKLDVRIMEGVLLSLCCLLLSGCADGHMGYSVHPDGSVHEEHSIQVDDYFLKQIPEWKKQLADAEQDFEKKNYMVERKNNGAVAKKDYASFREVPPSVKPNTTWSPDERNGGVRYRKGFFYDTYSLDLPYEANESMRDRSFLYQQPQTAMDATLQELFKQGMEKDVFDFTLNLPYAADDSNAASTTAEGRELVWNLKPAMLGNKDVTVRADFRIYHKSALAATGVVGGILALYAIAALAMAVRKGEASPLGRWALPTGAVALFVVCIFGGVAAYQMKHPPQLTNADRIYNEATRDSEGRPLADGLKRLDQGRKNPLDGVADILKEQGITDSVLAASESDDAGFLALLQDKNGSYYYVVYNAKNKQAAEVYDHLRGKGIQSFRKYTVRKDGKVDYEPLIFSMRIKDDPNHSGKNAASGGWNKGTHTVPVYVLFNVDDQDRLTNKKFTTGRGYYPSHYMEELKNPVYLDLADTVAEKASSLKLDIRLRGIDVEGKNAGQEGKNSNS